MAKQSTSQAHGSGADDLNISFADTRAEKLIDIMEQLRKKDEDGYYKTGVVYEPAPNGPYKGVLHFGDPYAENKMIVKSIPTRCSQADIEAITKKIIWFPETTKMYFLMAAAFEARMPAMFEGPTNIGKTFNFRRFTELIKGKGVKGEEFQCDGQSNTGNLFAKHVPSTGAGDANLKRWEQFLETDYAKAELEAASSKLHGAKGLDPSVRASLMQSKVRELALAAGLATESAWKIELGAVFKAFVATIGEDGKTTYEVGKDGRGGEGNFLMIDEYGTAKPNVAIALNQLRGANRRVNTSIRCYEAGGIDFQAGAEYWFMAATNPPEGEGYLERSAIDASTARGYLYTRFDDLSPKSYMMAAEKLVGFKAGNGPERRPPGCFLEYNKHPELTRELARVIALFHLEYKEALKAGEEDREQVFVASLDDISSTATQMLSTQVLNPNTRTADMIETLKAAVEQSYLNRHTVKFAENMRTHLDSILNHKVSARSWRGQVTPLGKIIETLTAEAALAPSKRVAVANTNIKKGVAALGADVPDEVRKMLGDLAGGL